MVDQGVARVHHAVVQGPLECVERQVGAKRVRHSPAHNSPRAATTALCWPIRIDFHLFVVGLRGPWRHRHRECRKRRIPDRSKLERRADRYRQAKVKVERNHLFEAAIAPPHLAAACEDVPDLADRAMTTCMGHRAGGKLEVGRTRGRQGEELAHVGSVRCSHSGFSGQLPGAETRDSFVVRHGRQGGSGTSSGRVNVLDAGHGRRGALPDLSKPLQRANGRCPLLPPAQKKENIKRTN